MLRLGLIVILVSGASQAAFGQIFVNSPAHLPGGLANNDPTESVAFGDVDLDGDLDAVCANGNDPAQVQNRLWINLGGAQGGLEGNFVDETQLRLPNIPTQTRDVVLVDLDSDGDLDIECANSSQAAQQPSRFWINQGGAQGGSFGYFVDETSARWTNLASPNSSLWAGQLLAGGGYFSYPQSHAFADLDADGDLDLIAGSTAGAYGAANEPTRVFLNDGSGFFEEFNPSGFKLAGLGIVKNDPGLWCEGIQGIVTSSNTGQVCDIAGTVWDLCVADLDGDLDLDFLGARNNRASLFLNRSETGSLTVRDMSAMNFGDSGDGFHTEVNAGDLDRDGDVDLYGVDWAYMGYDASYRGGGAGGFSAGEWVPESTDFVIAGELVDYDVDGILDVFLGRDSSPDKLVRGIGNALLHFYEIPNAVSEGLVLDCWDAVAGDVDGDGDDDLLKAHVGPNQLLLNVVGPPDTKPPAITKVDHPSDFLASVQPTRIRASVLDNAAMFVTARNVTQLKYSLNSGAVQSVPMRWSGGQVFWGELPSSAIGNVRYFVTSTDSNGNTGASEFYSLDTGGGCSGHAETYCAGKVNSQGCTPSLFFTGAPSASAGNGFVLRTSGLVPNKIGLYFYSKTGPASTPFAGGLLCIAPPITRTAPISFGGSGPCSGQLNLDFNAHIAGGTDPGLVNGATVWVQAWARDPAAASGISTSNALRFTICQ